MNLCAYTPIHYWIRKTYVRKVLILIKRVMTRERIFDVFDVFFLELSYLKSDMKLPRFRSFLLKQFTYFAFFLTFSPCFAYAVRIGDLIVHIFIYRAYCSF